MKCEYRIREDKITDQDGNLHTVYGVEVWQRGVMLRCLPDIFFQRDRAEYYIGLFNKLKLSIVHLDDVIEEII